MAQRGNVRRWIATSGRDGKTKTPEAFNLSETRRRSTSASPRVGALRALIHASRPEVAIHLRNHEIARALFFKGADVNVRTVRADMSALIDCDTVGEVEGIV